MICIFFFSLTSKRSNSKLQFPSPREFHAIYYGYAVQRFPDHLQYLLKDGGSLMAPVIVSMHFVYFDIYLTLHFILIACRSRER